METLRLLGRGVYDTFAKSLFAKVILASLGSGHSGARTGLKWIAHVYKLTSNHAVARFQEVNDTVAMIELESVWSFPDSYHVGIFEGRRGGVRREGDHEGRAAVVVVGGADAGVGGGRLTVAPSASDRDLDPDPDLDPNLDRNRPDATAHGQAWPRLVVATPPDQTPAPRPIATTASDP